MAALKHMEPERGQEDVPRHRFGPRSHPGQPVVLGDPAIQPSPVADGPGPHETRPFGFRFARSLQPAERRAVRYCHQLQVAVDHTGRPLIERAGAEEDQSKEWESKTYSDGDEGQEEDTWGREGQ